MLENLNSRFKSSSKQVKEASKLFCQFLVSLNELYSLPKVLQLTQVKSDLAWEEKVNVLRDASNEIFEWAYKSICDKVNENDRIYQRILPLEEYQKKYEKYIQRALLPLIEA